MLLFSQGDDVKALLRDAMIPDISTSQLLKASKVDIASKGLTAAGASLLNSELPLGFRGDGGQQGTSVPSATPDARSGAAGTGDGSDQGFQKKTGMGISQPLLKNISLSLSLFRSSILGEYDTAFFP